jgi:hypothetical protein
MGAKTLCSLLILPLSLLLAWRLTMVRAAQDVAAAKGPTPLYYGVKQCIDCHKKGTEWDDAVCECKEVQKWEKDDKHKEATNQLTSPRALAMAQALGKDVTKEKSCLACHGIHIADKALEERSKKIGLFDARDGVSCVACHGAFEEWVDAHGSRLKSPEWRRKTREQKENEAGMRDLWNPAKRTQLCVACHVGDAGKEKLVTHEMFAAGHPPLPSIEMATFSDEMPRHWQYLKEKKPAVQKRLGIDPERAGFERTELVLISGIATFQAQMQTLAAEAKRADAKSILDLAQFDCYACHHELRKPSIRQPLGTPGRPSFPRWPLALLRLSLFATGHPVKELDEQLRELRAAFDAQPYGDPKRIAKAADALDAWAKKLLEEVGRAKLDKEQSQRLLGRICVIAGDVSIDYDSARQLAWAFRVIKEEWQPSQELSSRLDAVLTELSKEVKLDLPSGQHADIMKDLKTALHKRADFDPAKLRQRFQQLATLLQAG